jgi:hypothetical protein
VSETAADRQLDLFAAAGFRPDDVPGAACKFTTCPSGKIG